MGLLKDWSSWRTHHHLGASGTVQRQFNVCLINKQSTSSLAHCTSCTTWVLLCAYQVLFHFRCHCSYFNKFSKYRKICFPGAMTCFRVYFRCKYCLFHQDHLLCVLSKKHFISNCRKYPSEFREEKPGPENHWTTATMTYSKGIRQTYRQCHWHMLMAS